jgi:DNA primase large subunit
MNVNNSRRENEESYLKLFYEDPDCEIDLLELEKISIQRFKVLKDLELRKKKKKETPDAFANSIKTLQISNEIYPKDAQTHLNDRISHFILKLSVCHSVEESKWWIETETKLFKYRCEELKNYEELLRPHITFESCTEVPFMHPYDKILYDQKFQSSRYLKIPLSMSAALLNKKDYFPINGYCYIKPSDLSEIVYDIFRSGLSLAISACQKINITDERIHNIFTTIKDPDFDFGYKTPVQNREINLSNIDAISKVHFPPCMKRLYLNLKSNHHLKYNGRLQFGLFLKALGLPLEESLQFWRKMFSEKINSEKFAKGYEYNIKHSYGKAGKMADYTPWSCNKITKMAKPPQGDFHGCPFRHCEKGELIGILNSYPKLDPETKEWILKRHEKEPQVSCIKLFDSTHKGIDPKLTEKIGIFPNAFFDASFEYR